MTDVLEPLSLVTEARVAYQGNDYHLKAASLFQAAKESFRGST